MIRSHILRYTFVAVASAGLLAACGGDEEHEHGEGDVAAEFCEHAQDGPFQTVTAAATATAAPSASFEHTSITVTLVDYQGQKGGCVSMEADEANEFILAVSDDAVAMKVMDSAGAEVTAEKTEANDDCTEIARMDTFDLEMGTYSVCFGPTALTELKFGFEEGAHAHEE